MINQYVVFVLDEQRYALHLSVVDRVVHAVHITALPQAPDIVLGVISMQGRIVPVINVRRRFRHLERAIALTDQLIFARTARRVVALLVDRVINIVECAEQDLIVARNMAPAIDYVEGVIRLKDGLILVHDLDAFLSLEEEASVDRAMGAA